MPKQVFGRATGTQPQIAFTQSGRKRLSIHVVVSEETREAVDNDGQILTKSARHAWICSRPITRGNAHERCNLGARYRWGIEAGFLVEKHHGYHYEHAFALDWRGSCFTADGRHLLL